MYKSIIFYFVLSASLTFSHKAMAEGPTIRGLIDCAEWVEARGQNQSIALEHYIQGFINGLSLGKEKDFWFSGGVPISEKQVFLWLDKYCKDNPLSNPVTGSLELFEEKAN